MNLLWVYGTLKKGHQRSQLLLHQHYLGTATTKPIYRMYQMGSFPALVRVPEGQEGRDIHGELYEIGDETLIQLDKVESVSTGLFERAYVELDKVTLVNLPVVQIVFDDYSKGRAVTYFFKRTIEGAPRDCGSFWALK